MCRVRYAGWYTGAALVGEDTVTASTWVQVTGYSNTRKPRYADGNIPSVYGIRSIGGIFLPIPGRPRQGRAITLYP